MLGKMEAKQKGLGDGAVAGLSSLIESKGIQRLLPCFIGEVSSVGCHIRVREPHYTMMTHS